MVCLFLISVCLLLCVQPGLDMPVSYARIHTGSSSVTSPGLSGEQQPDSSVQMPAVVEATNHPPGTGQTPNPPEMVSFGHVTPLDIDSIFSPYTRDVPGCAVGVSHKGTLIFAGGYGAANLDYGIPIHSRSRFMVASVSKQFTAAALLMLEQQGKLDLDEDLRTYIPELPEFEDPITARQLIHHTSGLRDLYNLLTIGDIGLDNTTTSDQALSLISRQQGLNFRPGTAYLYSNTGYFLMSVLVRNISGMSLREYTEKHLFAPSGMNATHFHDDTGMIVPDRVISYRHTRNGPGRFYRDNMDRVGARGLFTTIEDMARWDRNFIENRTKLENFTERMTKRGVTRYGYTLDYATGLRIERYRGLDAIGHNGNYMGFRSSYLRFPAFELGIMVFCNQNNINPAMHIQQLADLYLNSYFRMKFREFAGLYRNENFGTVYEIAQDGGELYLIRDQDSRSRLLWRDDDFFRAGGWDLDFRRNEYDEIKAVKIKTDNSGTLTFKRITR